MIEIDARDFAKAADALAGAGLEAEAGPVIALAIRDMATLTRRKVRQRLSRHRRTGRLQSHVTQTASGVGFDFTEVVKSGSPVAHLIAGGVRRHEIRSIKPMPIMRRGVLGFAQLVEHPGFRGDPYFHKGVQDAQAGFQVILDKAAGEMVTALAARVSR